MSDAATPAERGERIAKWLARAGVASRRDAEKLIEEGRVRLNGAAVTHPATFVNDGDIVQVGNKVVDTPDRARLWRYHKPEGLVTTHKDPEDRPTVFQRLPEHLPRVVSVGRLDLNSEGLAAAHQRWRAGAAAGAAVQRLDTALPGAGARRGAGALARRVCRTGWWWRA